jgi:hypothetical protein
MYIYAIHRCNRDGVCFVQGKNYVYETGTGYTNLTTYKTVTGKSKSRPLRKKYEKYDEARTERSRIP